MARTATAASEATATVQAGPEPTATPACTRRASYERDLTIPDNTRIEGGEPFTKTWEIRNSGTCTWGPGWSLTHVEGDHMAGPDSVEVPDTPGGERAAISVRLVAPDEGGIRRGTWQMCASDGQCFGDQVTVLIVSVARTPTPSPTPEWAGASRWILHEGQLVGVQEIAWSYRIDRYIPEEGKIFVSLYIVAMNNGSGEVTFSPDDFGLVDGAGEIHGRLVSGAKEPEFPVCTVEPSGGCEGWWTAAIRDLPEVTGDLYLRWDAGTFETAYEIPIGER